MQRRISYHGNFTTSYYNSEAPLFGAYPHGGHLNYQVPEQHPQWLVVPLTLAASLPAGHPGDGRAKDHSANLEP